MTFIILIQRVVLYCGEASNACRQLWFNTNLIGDENEIPGMVYDVGNQEWNDCGWMGIVKNNIERKNGFELEYYAY